MRYGRAWAALVAVGVVMGVGGDASEAQESPLEVTAGLAIQTTYVFRGTPQYNDDETPSLRLRGLVDLEHGPGRWSFGLQTASSLNQRRANSQLGSADEIIPSLSYTWDLSPRLQWSFGAVDYLRPQDVEVNFRAEGFTRVGWRALDSPQFTLTPYLAVYGEFINLLGVFAEVGVISKADLGEGFTLDSALKGGFSQYSNEDERFNYSAVEVALTYTLPVLPELSASAFVSTSLTQNQIQISTEFFERHNVTWSGLRVVYVALPKR